MVGLSSDKCEEAVHKYGVRNFYKITNMLFLLVSIPMQKKHVEGECKRLTLYFFLFFFIGDDYAYHCKLDNRAK